MEILHRISPLVEQVSIDEAFVDITGTERLHGPSLALAHQVKASIREATSLTCSVGIAPNKFLAKIASDFNKPDGLTILEQDQVAEFLGRLPVGKIPGVGRKTGEELRKLGVLLVSDILKFPARFWEGKFGKWGALLHSRALGIDDSAVEPYCDPKSISSEQTFSRDTGNIVELEKMLLSQAEEVGRELRKLGFKARTVTLKIKLSDFKSITRSRTLPDPFNTTDVLFNTGHKLLADLKLTKKVRLIGIGVSNFFSGPSQMRINSSRVEIPRQQRLDRALDKINSRFSQNKVVRGRMMDDPTTLYGHQEHQADRRARKKPIE
jgi:DNA polymerase-4